jgi:hypothetical protein
VHHGIPQGIIHGIRQKIDYYSFSHLLHLSFPQKLWISMGIITIFFSQRPKTTRRPTNRTIIDLTRNAYVFQYITKMLDELTGKRSKKDKK